MESEFNYYPTQLQCAGKIISLDTFYASTCRGLLKIVSIALCFFAVVLVCASQPVQDERGPALFFTFLGIVGSFSILLEYTFMLNTKIASRLSFVLESIFYTIEAVGLFIAAIFMLIFCANHWSNMNPEWATMPSLATAALFLCSGLYLIELCLLVSDARRCTWQPTYTTDKAFTTVLPA